ncbi:MAG: choice-of-anchor I family protein [Rhodospirillaceae bacterium]
MTFRGMLTGSVALGLLAAAAPAALADNHGGVTPSNALVAAKIGSYDTGLFDEGGSEIVAYDAATQRLFITNGNDDAVDVIDISDASAPKKVMALPIEAYGDGLNSVATKNGLVAIAVEGEEADSIGKVVFYDTNGTFQSDVDTCALPDMVTFTPDGSHAIVACEGEPNDEYTVDPEGGIAIIDLTKGAKNVTVTVAGFSAFEGKLPEGARIGKPGATLAQDMEPEYVAVSADSKTAYVSMQENNAIAVVDLAKAEITDIWGLGWKDHSQVAMDASNKDGGINMKTWPVFGMYQPDSIAAFEVGGRTFIATANEGDARDYDGWSEEARVKDLTLDATAFPNAAELQQEENLGRLKTTTTMGDTDGDGDHDQIFAYGARSFSILDASGKMVYDSADILEKITAAADPENFNSTDNENGSFDDRSDDKGPEPEAIATGVIDGVPYIFVGLERVGGIAIFSAEDPTAPVFSSYINTRDFSGDPEASTAGDLAPEGIAFISAEDSPTGAPLLAVAFEVSGTTALFELQPGSS